MFMQVELCGGHVSAKVEDDTTHVVVLGHLRGCHQMLQSIEASGGIESLENFRYRLDSGLIIVGPRYVKGLYLGQVAFRTCPSKAKSISIAILERSVLPKTCRAAQAESLVSRSKCQAQEEADTSPYILQVLLSCPTSFPESDTQMSEMANHSTSKQLVSQNSAVLENCSETILAFCSG